MLTLQAKLTSFEAVLADPLHAPIAGQHDLAACCMQVFQFIARVGTRQEANAVSIYVKRMQGEHQALFAHSAMTFEKKKDLFATSTAFGEILTAHSLAFQK